ncbi:MAG TPA: phage Gp37/Gp68 family protein [Planctomycetota bacterium]|nr:phage Gp37/Gp68 family protein [Planctomycetota bacterium]
MAGRSSIEWTDATWNPVRGCVKISPGCAHCYAERFAERFRGVAGHPYEQGFDLRFVPGALAEPLRWGEPRRVFVNSMSDLFLDEVPVEFIRRVVRVMEVADWHVFQTLTKRAARMRDLLNGPLVDAARLPNAWWGVSVEDRRHGLPRIDALRDVPSPNRFLSVEPLLEDLGEVDLSGVAWVVCGGESGPGARPLDPAWVRRLSDRCAAAGVPFFFKQWGGVHKSRTGRLLDGRTHDAVPSWRRATPPDPARRRELLRTAAF